MLENKSDNKQNDIQHNNTVVMMNVTCKPFMQSVIMMNVIMMNVIMMNVIMMNVIMMNVIMMNVIMMSVVAPIYRDL